jgi:SOS-response transcriptional repressor LexA
MSASLTDIERKILDYMVHYLRSNTYQPSIREIGERFGIKSTKTVSEHPHTGYIPLSHSLPSAHFPYSN